MFKPNFAMKPATASAFVLGRLKQTSRTRQELLSFKCSLPRRLCADPVRVLKCSSRQYAQTIESVQLPHHAAKIARRLAGDALRYRAFRRRLAETAGWDRERLVRGQ